MISSTNQQHNNINELIILENTRKKRRISSTQQTNENNTSPSKTVPYQYRGSKYTGVAKNGRAWQTQAMIDNEKVYLGIHEDAEKAAMLYDIAMI